jgi:hypothetical protein
MAIWAGECERISASSSGRRFPSSRSGASSSTSSASWDLVMRTTSCARSEVVKAAARAATVSALRLAFVAAAAAARSLSSPTGRARISSRLERLARGSARVSSRSRRVSLDATTRTLPAGPGVTDAVGSSSSDASWVRIALSSSWSGGPGSIPSSSTNARRNRR